MDGKILDPLDFYLSEARDGHRQNAQALFERHLEDSGLDADDNQRLAEAYDASAAEYKSLKDSKTCRVLLGCLAGLLIAIGIALIAVFREGAAYPVVGVLLLIPSCIWLFGRIIPEFRDLKQRTLEKYEESEKLLLPPKEQLELLDRTFEPGEGLRLFEQTVPDFRFFDYCSAEHQALMERCDFSAAADRDSSVTDTLAGNYRGNPYLFTTVLHHTMCDRVYTGSETIYWQEEELQQVRKERSITDSDGSSRTETYYEWEYVTVDKEETLKAKVTAPAPCYSRESSLAYGHHAAPDLCFSRRPKHIQKKSEERVRARVARKSHALRSKSEQAVLAGQQYVMMANEEFEVLFGASDRNNDHQFRVLFTPQAQKNMVALLKDSTLIGDEFFFRKAGRCSIIPCDGRVFGESPRHYHDYSVQEARKNYLNHQQEYFRSLFGIFSPLLAITGYQEPAPPMPGLDVAGHFASWEHEAAANHFPLPLLVTDDCRTEAVLKTKLIGTTEKADIVEVTASAYTAKNRVETFRMLGGDGSYHDVDVDWVEYIPRTKVTAISIEALSDEAQERLGQSGGIRYRGLYARIMEQHKEES